ncbi:hypothetical protein [Herbidospora mongoliensis]|nr:hypothetical protein [Herbidospora mongoliensis]
MIGDDGIASADFGPIFAEFEADIEPRERSHSLPEMFRYPVPQYPQRLA